MTPNETPDSWVQLQKSLEYQTNSFSRHLGGHEKQNQYQNSSELQALVSPRDCDHKPANSISSLPSIKAEYQLGSSLIGKILPANTAFVTPPSSASVARPLPLAFAYGSAPSSNDATPGPLPSMSPRVVFNSDLFRPTGSQDAAELTKEVSGLREKHQQAVTKNQQLRELNKLLLSKLMHLHRAVQLIGH